MQEQLNITNGDCAVEIMIKAGVRGEILPWRDVLHDGPVPDTLDLRQLSKVRAQFLVGQGWGDALQIRHSFTQRDKILESIDQFKKVVLWFEHDLYDQLQLLQVLDWLGKHKPLNTEITMICVDQYLGMMTSQEINALIGRDLPVSDQQYKLAHRAWAAFRATTPEKWFALSTTDTSALTYLAGAIDRQLEELPSFSNGLSKTAQMALNIINKGETRPAGVFERYQDQETRRFLGDLSFWGVLNELLSSSPPLIRLTQNQQLRAPIHPEESISITAVGKEVLNAKRDWLEITQLDKWIGGVHLSTNNVWRWDGHTRSLVNPNHK